MFASGISEIIFRFLGCGTVPASPAANCPWVIADTSAAGTPTYAVQSNGELPELLLQHSSTNEVQNVCLFQNDLLSFPLAKLLEVEWFVKANQATQNAATSFACGLASARNDDPDAIATNAMFRVLGASQTLYLETDDGVTDNDDKNSGHILTNAYKSLLMSFARGLGDVRFFVNGQPALPTFTFSMAAAAAQNVQPFAQIQKTASTNTDGVRIQYCRVKLRTR